MMLKSKKSSVRLTSSVYTATPKYGKVFSANMRGSNQSSSKMFDTPVRGSRQSEGTAITYPFGEAQKVNIGRTLGQ